MSQLDYLQEKVRQLTEELDSRGDASQLTIMDYVGEMVFEAGEFGDAVKKRRRMRLGFPRKRNPLNEEIAMEKIKKEAGDLFMCFIRVCDKLGIDPWECIEMKYNILVEEEGASTPISKEELDYYGSQGTLF